MTPPHRAKPELAKLLDETLLVERRALARALDKLGAHPDDAALAAWCARVEAARARYAARAASVPPVRVDESLPIAARSCWIAWAMRGLGSVFMANSCVSKPSG